MLLRALALATMTFAASAGAQFSGTVSVVSDYRFRGVSLSQQKPAAQIGIGYDGPSGWYAGLFGSTVQLAGASATTEQAVAYLGVVTSISGELHWDLGAVYSNFSATRDYSYAEVQTAITSTNYSARLHYSPDYFGFGRGSYYGELNRTQPLGNGFALLGHVGVLAPVGHRDYQNASPPRIGVDVRAGLTFEIAGFAVQLAWVGSNGNGALYPVNRMQSRNTTVAAVSRSF